MLDPFAAPGVWLRCALHAHTTNSDGEMPPRFLARHYEWAGFDVLALTDHYVRTEAPPTERLLVIPSTELDADVGHGPGRVAHVLALGGEGDPGERPTRDYPPLAEVVDWINSSGGLPFLAHPYWSGLRTVDFESCDGLLGIEVYNAGCELECGRGLSAVHWDDLLDAGRPAFGLATDDTHHPGHDSAHAWTWVRAAERSADAVLAALRDGAFYGSTGPVLHEVALADSAVEVRCTPAAAVTLLAGRTRGTAVHAGRLGYAYGGDVLETDGGGAIVAARLRVPKSAPYARLEVRDAAGRVAWTNPLPLDR